MIRDTIIRRVHKWASERSDPVSVSEIAKGMDMAISTAHNAMAALMEAGFASRERERKLPTQFLTYQVSYLYFVTGTADQVAAVFSDGLQLPPPPPPLYANANSIFAYGDRCAAACAAKGP